jgi:hypothetical protein
MTINIQECGKEKNTREQQNNIKKVTIAATRSHRTTENYSMVTNEDLKIKDNTVMKYMTSLFSCPMYLKSAVVRIKSG